MKFVVGEMRSHSLFSVIKSAGKSCYHLVTRPDNKAHVVTCYETACISLVGTTFFKSVIVINLVTR